MIQAFAHVLSFLSSRHFSPEQIAEDYTLSHMPNIVALI